MTTSRYCVVGAGAAGLAAVQVLTRQGFAVDCFERRDRVGGHWHTDYESLHLITSRDMSGFEGHPMPPEFPVYPSRDQMRAYIESFADRFDLRRHVTFGSEVTGMDPRPARAGLGVTMWTGGAPSTTGCWSRTGTCGTRTCRRSPPTSPGCPCTPRSTGTWTTSKATGCSSSAPATRDATWPSTRPTPA